MICVAEASSRPQKSRAGRTSSLGWFALLLKVFSCCSVSGFSLVFSRLVHAVLVRSPSAVSLRFDTLYPGGETTVVWNELGGPHRRRGRQLTLYPIRKTKTWCQDGKVDAVLRYPGGTSVVACSTFIEPTSGGMPSNPHSLIANKYTLACCLTLAATLDLLGPVTPATRAAVMRFL